MDAFYQYKIFDYLAPALKRAGYEADKVIYGYSDGPRPEGQYCIINILDIDSDLPTEVNYSYTPNPALQIKEKLIYRARMNFTIDLYGDGSLLNARMVKAFLSTSQMKEASQYLGLGFSGYGATANLTTVRNGVYEKRVSFPLSMNITFTYDEMIQTIGQVRIKGVSDLGVQIMDKIITENG